MFYSLADARVTEIMRLAREFLQGSEVYVMACEVIDRTGELDESLANVTGWLGKPRAAELAAEQS